MFWIGSKKKVVHVVVFFVVSFYLGRCESWCSYKGMQWTFLHIRIYKIERRLWWRSSSRWWVSGAAAQDSVWGGYKTWLFWEKKSILSKFCVLLDLQALRRVSNGLLSAMHGNCVLKLRFVAMFYTLFPSASFFCPLSKSRHSCAHIRNSSRLLPDYYW